MEQPLCASTLAAALSAQSAKRSSGESPTTGVFLAQVSAAIIEERRGFEKIRKGVAEKRHGMRVSLA
jgi:hypothetical protein